MTFKEKLLHHEWVQPFLPNYMKPLQEPRIEEGATSLMIHETEEFLSDLSSLSELPRLNKTFKRKIKGFLLKVKIKPKKLHLELIDTKRSPAEIKKRIYITTYRKTVKAENGLGKCIDATIYFQLDGRNIVRNIKHHSLFRPVFTHLHMLDSSLSGQSVLPAPVQSAEDPSAEGDTASFDEEKIRLTSELRKQAAQFNNMNNDLSRTMEQVSCSLNRCLEEFDLLDIEERHQIKRMIVKEIPQLTSTYQSLTAAQKHEKKDDMITALHKMNHFALKIASSLDQNRMERMNHLLRVNKMRYDDEN
ncbi:hypothetical protein CR205_07135 [Alteribacter lacisalsi]|uniref:Uncharacterized protein n=1 Tax=Alteribacter lacisalsi TaxID=2045244 RepID=A0A2W0HMQ9_9BACI|nr:hypothetical protein [Alteribacter lacisalsi]PYZ98362.1 hypothetical protein CR205_07135 [Alteribacter lacisalsi]